MGIFKRILLGLLICTVIFCIGFTLWLRDRYVVPIITYHHVGIPSVGKYRLNTVSVDSFKYQMSFLKRHGFEVISFDDLVEGLKKGHTFARNTVVIQFDDGYEDNYTFAFPILKKYNLPAMVFLVSDKIGAPGFLTWDEMREMEKDNFMAGAHTRHHVYLPEVSLAQARDEIAGSKTMIEDHLGHQINYFAYPSGGFSVDIKQIVQEAGYKAAVTTNRGKYYFNEDLYELKRIRMSNTDNRWSGLIMWFKLSGYYNLFREAKDPGLKKKLKTVY
ncbi:MAG: polysaccharide deacetylase family protein [Candidatus Omnitrophica bacterium]|nr:polysaccharide deacetylase family protein [Candidatus Omnitrophota bacterium]